MAEKDTHRDVLSGKKIATSCHVSTLFSRALEGSWRKSRMPHEVEGRGAGEGESHVIYHTYLKLTLSLMVYVGNLFKIYYLLAWLLE